MGEIHLSKRLQTLVHAVTPGHRVADVGTDHALVPITLIREGISPGAIASDINEGPLIRARGNIASFGLTDSIETRLGNGLDSISPEEVDTVICAGMGGALMEQLLSAHREFFAAGIEFILSPHLEWYRIRRLLRLFSYRIIQEWFLFDEGKYYVIMKAGPGNPEQALQEDPHQDLFDLYGEYLLQNSDPLLLSWLESRKSKQMLLLEKLKTREDSPAIRKRIRELQGEIHVVQSAIFFMQGHPIV